MRALQITLKDLRLLARDKRAAVVLLALPLIFITIIGISTGQLLSFREGGDSVTVAVVNLARPSTADVADEAGSDAPETDAPANETLAADDAATDASTDALAAADAAESPDLARQLIANIEKHGHFQLTMIDTHERALEELDRGKAVVVLVIGPEFPARVGELELGDVLSMSKGRIAAGPSSLDLTLQTKPALAKIGELSAAVIFGDVVRTIAPVIAGNSKNVFVRNALRVAEQRARTQPPVEFTAVELVTQKKAATSVLYEMLVPSYTVLFVFFLVNIMARSFIAERELGTLRRLRLAPVTPLGVLIGKNIPFYLLSLIQTSLLFLFGRLLFKMSWGVEPWLLIPIITATSLAATALGMMVATIIRTDAQVSAFGNSLVIILAGISGCFMPREWLPDLMKKISLGTPHAWALIAYNEILGHSHIDHAAVFRCCGMLLVFASGFFLIGWLRFRSQIE